MRLNLEIRTVLMVCCIAITETHMEHLPHFTGTVFHVRTLYL
jgi:hypothetical protein